MTDTEINSIALTGAIIIVLVLATFHDKIMQGLWLCGYLVHSALGI